MTKQEKIQQLLSTFAYHSNCIMEQEYLHTFSLGTIEEGIVVKMEITKRNKEKIWDQVSINGKHVGNRCAAREEYARLCAPLFEKILTENYNQIN